MEHRAKVIPVQIADATSTYAWKEGNESKVNGKRCNDLRTLCEGIEETASSVEVFFRARNLFKHEGVGVVFVPSYSPARYFALFAAAKSLGLRTVMMNESHAGTEKAAGCKKWIKRQIVKQFDAAFVGGAPHKRHFSALGIPEGKIFTGYDAVDNGFFSARADEALRMEHDAKHLSTLNSQHSTKQGPRSACGLPERYFLNLGRMVPKKNLSTLVEAYARFARASVEVKGGGLKVEGTGAAASPPQGEGSDVVGSNRSLATRHLVPALVFVGSGELECELEAQARSLGLEVVDRRGWKSGNPGGEERSSLNQEDRGAIFFYGFRQLDENPIFYALAEAFVLPSLYEEWGLVVNEAMACSLPVIVSRTAGCAEDLLPGSGPVAENCKLNTENSFEPRSNGFLFDPTSVEALAEALRRIVEMGDGRWEMGKQSRKIVANFGCENFARQVLAAAEAASGGKGSGC
ncbi:MAG: glycosyltransferase family 4 protein [Chthoniobacterales bacterium]|nr:glycosyltransferase family 4 protein [Chthoniobacterales bacterium]